MSDRGTIRRSPRATPPARPRSPCSSRGATAGSAGIAWALALWIGLSRIYLGRHFPTDVLTGSLLGAIASWLVLRGERWFEKFHF